MRQAPGRGATRVRPAAPVRRATINDVATAAGVSRQTVTRAMNDMAGISASTKDRVLAAARDLSYRPSRFGRGLVKADHRMLGLVIDDLTNPYYPELASAVVGFAARQGWNVLLADTVHASDLPTLLGELTGQVDAVIGYLGPPDPVTDELLAQLPVVEVDPSWRPRGGAVVVDSGPAILALVEHLTARGVHRPVVLDASSVGRPSGRAELLVAAFAERGVACAVEHGDNTVAGSAAATAERLLNARPRFDAVLTFNDLMAMGVLMACRRAGVEVPDRLRVVGIDGLSMGTYVSPTLTTLAVDLAEVARVAVDLALGMRAGTLPWSGARVRRRVQHRLVLRESA